jgi:hypothetical protein
MHVKRGYKRTGGVWREGGGYGVGIRKGGGENREREIERYRMRGEKKPFTGFIDTEQKQRCSLTRMQ